MTNSNQHPPSPTIASPAAAPAASPISGPADSLSAAPTPPNTAAVEDSVEFAVFDPALGAAAVAAQPPLLAAWGEPVMAAGWWSAVVAPEDPRALELRHLPDLPAADAARITALFAEVVDAGGACTGEAWEVLWLWERGDSPSAAAAANAVMILVCREAEAEEAAGFPSMPSWVKDNTEARWRDLLDGR